MGKPLYNINPTRLRLMYLDKSIPMDSIAYRFGCTRRTITEHITAYRKLNPDLWPKRYLTKKDRGEA